MGCDEDTPNFCLVAWNEGMRGCAFVVVHCAALYNDGDGAGGGGGGAVGAGVRGEAEVCVSLACRMHDRAVW